GSNGACASSVYHLVNSFGNLVFNTGISAGSISIQNSEASKTISLAVGATAFNCANPAGSVSLSTNNASIISTGGALLVTGSGTFTTSLGSGAIDLTAATVSPALDISSS